MTETSSDLTTTKQKLFAVHFHLPWDLPPFQSLPDSITLGPSHNIPFSDSARNLGVILDSNLSMKKHILKICHYAYFELKHIRSIRRFLTEDAAKTLVTSYILSRLDYCNCLLMGTPNSVIQPLQKIQNFAPRLVLLALSLPCRPPPLNTSPGKLHFPLQNILSIKSLVCVSVLWMVLVLLTFLNCYMSTLRLVHYALLLTPASWKSSNTNARVMSFVLSVALDPTFGIHSHKTLDTAQTCHLFKLKAKLKTFLFSQYFHPN